MQIAGEIADLDERRQAALTRRLELARVLAQLRRDEVVAEMAVDLFLRLGGEHCPSLDSRDAVLGDREATANGILAQRDVVILRAAEVLQQVAIALRRHDPQIETQSVAGDHGRLRIAVRDDLGNERQLHECSSERGGVCRRGDQVEVAKGLASATDAARFGDAQSRWMCA